MDTIKRLKSMPKGAEYIAMTECGEFIQNYYRINELWHIEFYTHRGYWLRSQHDNISEISNKVYQIV